MRTKRMVQTGPKTELGGTKLGFTKVSYHESIEGVVKMAPIAPAS